MTNIVSLLVLAGSKTAEIEGISAAGSPKESRRYTAVADAELLLKGPSALRKWPLPPLSAGSFFQFVTIAPEFFIIGINGSISYGFKFASITASTVPSANKQ